MLKPMKFAIVVASFSIALFGSTAIAHAQNAGADFLYAYRYDLNHHVTGEISPDPDGAGPIAYPAIRYTYDIAGQLIRTEIGELASWQPETVAPPNWTGFTVWRKIDVMHDDRDRKIKETLTSGTTILTLTQYSYDSLGRPECTAVRMNPSAFTSPPASACLLGTEGSFGPDRITKLLYDLGGRLVGVKKAVGTVNEQNYLSYTYTDNGKQKTVTDANGNVATYAYDGFDRQIAWIFPSKTDGTVSAACTIGTITETGGVTSPSEVRGANDDCEKYAYDRSGNRKAMIKRDGQIVRYDYDALDRITRKDVPDSTMLDVYYAYDLRGLQTEARFGSLSGQGVSNRYDGFGRLKTSTTTMGGTSRKLAYDYDANGNRVRLTFPDEQYFSFDYDGLDRMIGIKENGITSAMSFSYNNRGLRYRLQGGPVSTYTFDGAGRLTTLSHALSGTTGSVVFGFTGYNPANQLTNRTVNNAAHAWTGHVNIDRGYAINGLNQYVVAGPASYCYDPNGNMTLSDNPGQASAIYRYDVENRLIEARAKGTATCADLGTAGAQQASLSYDPMGRLSQVSGGSAGVTQFLYNGDELVAEYDNAGALLRRYVHGPNVNEPVLWYEGGTVTAASRRHLRADHQNSVISVSDASGVGLAINRYDEYGIPAGPVTGRFAYTGQAWIPELGMYHYKARIYSPTLGRFLQTDPIGYEDQLNLYAYVANDPINKTDPTGMQECGACMADDRDNRAFLRGEISKEELTARREARAAGGLAGIVVVGTAIATRGFGLPVLTRWAGRVLGLERSAVISSKQAIQAFSTQVERAGFKSAGEVGKVVGWGGGRNAAAQATERTGQITKDIVAGMREQGLTKDLATSARDVYRSAVREGTGGATAEARLQLMDKILRNW